MSYNRSNIGNSKGKYRQGYYILMNPNKYLGDPTKIVYRSSWELAFNKFCDSNESIIKWSAENIAIPYQITNDIGQVEVHRYYPDYYIEMITAGNKEKYDRLVVEIKPVAELSLPKKPKGQTLKMLENYEYSLRTFKKNLHKWAYAKEWCERRQLKFLIITDDFLREKGLIR